MELGADAVIDQLYPACRSAPHPVLALLTGKPDAIREVAAALGVNYKKLDDGEYSHSSLFTLLSPKGEIILQHAGLSVNIDAFKAKIEK